MSTAPMNRRKRKSLLGEDPTVDVTMDQTQITPNDSNDDTTGQSPAGSETLSNDSTSIDSAEKAKRKNLPNGASTSEKEKADATKDKSDPSKDKPNATNDKSDAIKGKSDANKDKSDTNNGKPDAKNDKSDAIKGKSDANKDKSDRSSRKSDESNDKSEPSKGNKDSAKDKPDPEKIKPDQDKEKPDQSKGKTDASKDKSASPKVKEDTPKDKSDPAKGKTEATKEKTDGKKAQKKKISLGDASDKTRFERVNVAARPAVSKGKRRTSLRWKNNDVFDERSPVKVKPVRGVNARIKTLSREFIGGKGQGEKTKLEADEKTKFEQVNARSKPARSKKKRKNALKWKGSDADNMKEQATCEETVTQEVQEEDCDGLNTRTRFEAVNVQSKPALAKRHRKSHLKWKGSSKDSRRRPGSAMEEDATVDATVETDGVTQDEQNLVAPVANAIRMEPKANTSRSISLRALEMIRNGGLLEGHLSEKENVAVALFFSNPASLTTPVKKSLMKALGRASQRLKMSISDEEMRKFLEDREAAAEEMLTDLLNNQSLLPSCWRTSSGSEKASQTGTGTSTSERNTDYSTSKDKTPKDTDSLDSGGESSKEQKRSNDLARGVRKVLAIPKRINKSFRASAKKSFKSRRSERSQKSQRNSEKEKEKDNEEEKTPKVNETPPPATTPTKNEVEEREKKAWKQTEDERRSFLAFALPAAYRIFGWK